MYHVLLSAPVLAELIVTSEPWVDRSQDATVTCTSLKAVFEINWRKGPDLSNSTGIVDYSLSTSSVTWNDVVDQTHFVFDETSDSYPLPIKSATFEDESRYWCQVLDATSFNYVHNSTEIRIRGMLHNRIL